MPAVAAWLDEVYGTTLPAKVNYLGHVTMVAGLELDVRELLEQRDQVPVDGLRAVDHGRNASKKASSRSMARP